MTLNELRSEDVDLIYLDQDRVQWWAVMKIIMNIWVP